MPSLQYILTKRTDETFSLAWTNGPVELTPTDYVVHLVPSAPLTQIQKISTITDATQGSTKDVYFKKFFKYDNGTGWSDLLPLAQISGLTFDKCSELNLELFYYRVADSNSPATLYLDNVLLTGTYKFAETDAEALLPELGQQVIMSAPDIYKIFKLQDFEVISNHSQYGIKFRFTQDQGRSYTPWVDLDQANLSRVNLSPLRFAQVQYLVTNLSSLGQGLVVYDIYLRGEFQNVSANYLKTNRYGLKQDCLSTMANANTDVLHRDFYTACLGSYIQNTDATLALTNANKSTLGQLFNPYQFDKITQFANMLGNNVNNMFGWTVQYHRTDPDYNGTDTYVHEYALKNVVEMKNIKVLVPDNKFPLDHLIMNQFNLDLFDTFEIHIMKDEFKGAFGIPYRPGQDDILYFCEANMLFYVKHAQAFKNIMNAATYWKVILEKYEYKTNIRHTLTESKVAIDTLTQNTSLDDLLGFDDKNQEQKIANKEQFYPTSFDKARHRISKYVVYNRSTLYLDNFDFATAWYDLADAHLKSKPAVNYNHLDHNVSVADQRSFIFWVNFKNNYVENGPINTNVFNGYDITADRYTFLHNYDDPTKLGYELAYQGATMQVKLNQKQYLMGVELLTNVWYAVVINWDQPQRTLTQYIYRRDGKINVYLVHPVSFHQVTVDSEDLTGLTYYVEQGYKGYNNVEVPQKTIQLVASQTFTVEPQAFSHDQMVTVYGGKYQFTNLRILDEVIPSASIENLLKQNVVTDAQHLILADNCGKQLVTTNLWTKNFR